MDDVVFTVEFDGTDSNERANELLSKNWKLLHVGTKCVDIIDSTNQVDYETSYVLGANKEQYETYKNEIAESEAKFKKEFGE
ncbi:hypothetical protein [Companilactobacillus nodensis]|uniref:Uncharacterized protein n=1 Tax=Companilactobacillus nodensis DSM 19682 = JCM 14932 = NBRC 107160 TaxID=1423775 RepID=A0A0R1KED2_9LACO|nr:hypothetical protein [Companilactobacillus nodensis]KRK78785.1 hypothetical protein FD03_GL002567 [Companilactobacillus nodensis DSM 19682 = JCM 14932 = NBRC 107160]